LSISSIIYIYIFIYHSVSPKPGLSQDVSRKTSSNNRCPIAKNHHLCQATPQDNPSRTRALPRGKALGQRVRTRRGDCGDREAATKREMLKPSSVWYTYFLGGNKMWAIYEINPYPECFGHFEVRIPGYFSLTTIFRGNSQPAGINGHKKNCLDKMYNHLIVMMVGVCHNHLN